MNSKEVEAGTGLLYTRPFLLLCLSHALFASSFNMMLPELPAYLSSLGGAAYKGWILALFTLTAGISRPFSGRLSDTIGRIPVMYIGVGACIVCSLLYPLLPFVSGFLLLRFFHGFSTGFKPTGTTAYVADIVSAERRGEAMGILGICMSVGASGAPVLGSWLVKAFHSMQYLFYASAILALLSMLILMRLKETLQRAQKFQWSLLRIHRDDIFDPQAIPAGIVMVLCYCSYGVILTLAPDLSDHLGISNRGTFFAIFTLSSISTRFFAGRISDQLGRIPVLKTSVLVIAGAMLLFAGVQEKWVFYLASVVFGLGNGIFSPAINAWTIDLGDPEKKGRALATMFMALELAIGGGAALAGWYFADQLGHMPAIFYTVALMNVFAWIYLWQEGKK
ncbi:MAG: MFS transporter [Bacteroidetes bacterium]|nr:MFS transporter [Bacteroidota bacterium]